MSIKRYAAVAILGAAVTAIMPSTQREEGLALKPYIDPVGVLTWCYGETSKVPNVTLTKEYCTDVLHKSMTAHCLPAAKAIKVPVAKHELEAICDFSLNVGKYGAANSEVIRLLNKGDRAGAGDAFLNWYRAGGRDCRIRSNNCYGMWDRRLKERKHFLTGAGL